MNSKERKITREFLNTQVEKVLALAHKCHAEYYDHLRRWVFPSYAGDGSWDGVSLCERDFSKCLSVPEELSLLLQDAYRLGASDLANRLY